ncbi:MAG: hypothetical protein WC508_01575 [Patescibacteria group bacterium]
METALAITMAGAETNVDKVLEQNDWQIAVVNSFKAATGKDGRFKQGEGFGFVSAEGQQYFFHVSGCRRIECGGANENLEILACNQPTYFQDFVSPRRADQIVILATRPPIDVGKLPQVTKWARLLNLEIAVEKLNQATYWRIIRNTRAGTKSNLGKDEVLWQGNNFESLLSFVKTNKWQNLRDRTIPPPSAAVRVEIFVSHYLQFRKNGAWLDVDEDNSPRPVYLFYCKNGFH